MAGEEPCLHVLAAGSLRAPLESLAAQWGARGGVAVALRFDNARALAARIEGGGVADVFASASPEHPAALHARGLLDEPQAFATNRLVVAVPAHSDARDVGVLGEPGRRVVVEARGIPLGDYTRVLLGRLDAILGAGFAAAVLGNVVGEEQTVAAVAGRLYRGEADAGVLYSTDVAASGGRLRAIEVPGAAAVQGLYVIARVRGGPEPGAAQAWLALVHGPAGQAAMRAAGFHAAP